MVFRSRMNKTSNSRPFSTKQLRDTELSELELHYDLLFNRQVNFRTREILINGDVGGKVFELVDAALSEMEIHNKRDITIKINSFGGSVQDALAIIGRIEKSPRRVVTEGYGAIMSAATLILAVGDKRRISRYASFMHHESSYEIEGRHSAVKTEVAYMESMERRWAEWMAELTKKPASFWKKEGVGKDAYMTPEQLLEYGVVDEIF